MAALEVMVAEVPMHKVAKVTATREVAVRVDPAARAEPELADPAERRVQAAAEDCSIPEPPNDRG